MVSVLAKVVVSLGITMVLITEIALRDGKMQVSHAVITQTKMILK